MTPPRIFRFLAVLCFALVLPTLALAQDAPPKSEGPDAGWRTSSSVIRPSRYPDDFKHYDYVNPDAPKGGTLNQIANGSFDSFNPFIVRGTPAAGFAVFGGGLNYDTLMEQSPDEPGVSHALVAEATRFPADLSSVSFRLASNARWHDGRPITAEDVIWSFDTLKRLHPQWAAYYKNVTAAEKTGDREVTFRFDQTGNRELPNIMGDLTILPQHWWEGTDARGNKRNIENPTLEPPLGSGAYRVASFDPGSRIVWERVPDYWAANNPTRVGRNNFDRLSYVYFRDANAAWEAFKKGGLEDYRIENISRRWAQDYNFPAATNGEVLKKTLQSRSVESMQAYVLNSRVPKFADVRVRKALTLAFNFEDMNRTLFFGLYRRITSHFANSELAATGLPSEAELKLLEPLRDQLPPEVFTQAFALPDYSQPGAERTFLREALQLLTEAGYERRGAGLVDKRTGVPLTVEFLTQDPTESRIIDPYANQLHRLGIGTSTRVVDTSQYIARLRDFDFEAVSMRYPGQSLSPGNEQRDFWSTAAAGSPGSRNYAGIRNAAIDALIDRIVYAPDRDALVAATRALDRALLWNWYVVPQWYTPDIRLAYWNKFGMPEKGPDYAGIDPFSWWIAQPPAISAGAASADAASGGKP